ncbi:MAG: Gfo/Idh/MocA family oxidoreductase [Planctomycetes bacterium]|nr:Gfo/Idh/MocA family oxidoreductase [Planctomycetota bacterium]
MADTIRVGLVGCGGRGTGAAENCLASAPDVRLVALADLFRDRLDRSRAHLAGLSHPGVDIPDERCFVGFDAYARLLDSGVDLVLLATPPGFRPLHFEAAVGAGKHVFMEKPVAVDPPGVRRVIAAGEKAREKGLGVVAGTQYRHHEMFLETLGRVRDGAIGEIREARGYYLPGGIWRRPRERGESDIEWQIRNWYYMDWLSGDHIVEQHVHTLDVIDWGLEARPVRAVGSGGRQVRTDPVYGNVYDHFSIDYEYPEGVRVASHCRQWEGCAGHVGATFVGTRGTASPYEGRIEGENPWQYRGENAEIGHAYVREHTDLIESVRAGKPANEARQVAESTLTAILGREAAYTGRSLAWEEVRDAELALGPEPTEFGDLPVRPVPVPGRERS